MPFSHHSSCLQVLHGRRDERGRHAHRQHAAGQASAFQEHISLRASSTGWPKTVVTDARDVYDRLAKETGGLPEQKALTMEIAIVREWLSSTGATIRWTANENMIGDGLTKDQEKSRAHLARILTGMRWSIERVKELVRDTAVDGVRATRRRRRL